ncbi:hypothetical protein D1872_255500 [compost metagenome]
MGTEGLPHLPQQERGVQTEHFDHNILLNDLDIRYIPFIIELANSHKILSRKISIQQQRILLCKTGIDQLILSLKSKGFHQHHEIFG